MARQTNFSHYTSILICLSSSRCVTSLLLLATASVRVISLLVGLLFLWSLVGIEVEVSEAPTDSAVFDHLLHDQLLLIIVASLLIHLVVSVSNLVLPLFLQSTGEELDFLFDSIVVFPLALKDRVQDDARLVLRWVIEVHEHLTAEYKVRTIVLRSQSPKRVDRPLEVFAPFVENVLSLSCFFLHFHFVLVQLITTVFVLFDLRLSKQVIVASLNSKIRVLLVIFGIHDFFAEELHLFLNVFEHFLDFLGFLLLQVEVLLHLKFIRVPDDLVRVVVQVFCLEQHVLLPQFN